MHSTTLPTRQQIDDAAPLEFSKPTKRKRGITIQMCYHGALVSFAFSAEDDVPVRELEQSIDTLLRREGWSGAPTPAAGASKPKAEKVKPFYDGDGEACCPVHRKPLKEGQYGLYCSSKASTGEVANDKGYCNLRFIED